MKHHLSRREFVRDGAALAAAGASAPALLAAEGASAACTLENQYVKYSIAADGRNLHFTDKQSGKDYCAGSPGAAFARVKQDQKYHLASAVAYADGRLMVEFGDSGVRAVVGVEARKQYFLFEVLSVEGPQVEEFVFADVPLTLRGTAEEPLAACALALNLRTNVRELPRPGSRLRAICYRRFGLAGAKAALIGCPQARLREVMQKVVEAAEELPHSPIGGPWALGKAINQGSYLFNFGEMSEAAVDDWIKLARSLGMNQIDFHGGRSFRFGDCRPNPKTYPQGFKSLKAVVDRLHAAGIAAGLHTYAFFISKSCPWVTPVPDRRLATDASFTLAEAIAAKSDKVPVVEPSGEMSTITGFAVRNSVTLRIDDELITYGSVAKEPPYAFAACKRGACGTRPSAHAKGAKVHHLKECFGLFVPDPHTTLFAEVAGKTAEAFNECGFDMIYLDALDGSDVLGGRENAWHYGSKFVFEIWKRLKRPALMEMSTFHHHLWYVRSRYCAWDHPTRSHKKFIDIHCEANQSSRRMFLPGELGWWALKNWTDQQGEPTFADDIEYLMSKCLGTDTGFALMGIDPANVGSVPALPGLAEIVKRYEDLRHSGKVPESIKAKLRAPGDEYQLITGASGKPQFRPVQYAKHKVESGDRWSSVWETDNRFGAGPLRLRIEALMGAGPYDAPGNVTLADFAQKADFPVRASQQGVTAELQPSQGPPKAAKTGGSFTALNSRPSADGSWTKIEKQFSPPLNLAACQALGVWVQGDAQGEVLNFQLRSPSHISHAIGDHYVIVDFRGWRYFELIEPEGRRYADYTWPYGGIYSIYRERVNFRHVETLALWYNDLPPGKKVTCCLSPVRALPLLKSKLVNPTITVAGKTLALPVEIETGCYLELNSPSDCKLYGTKGELLGQIKPQGELPTLQPGRNEVAFRADAPGGVTPRASLTVISHGQPLKWSS